MTDLLLVFPPQWSPFQPALSLPSLSAWLKRAGFRVRSIDLNAAFYHWFLSDECARILVRQVDELDWSESIRLAYRTTFLNANQFRQDVHNLKNIRSGNDNIDPGECVKRHYLAIKSFETYLSAVSQVSEDFIISPYEFRLKAGNLQAPDLEHMVDSPPEILERFFRGAISDQILTEKPKMVGISCIGQDQLYFTLLLGALLKEQWDAPVVVGGTIFSRIFERGVLKPQWFHRFFDIIVRNEGEKPCERLLSNLVAACPLTEKVPGIVHCQGERIVSSVPCSPLAPADLPFPDFDDLPLDRYLAAEVTLPLLSSRGCYWGKCEFCHHGMVYGDKYGPYEPKHVLESVDFLARRYGVRHFAFNDEAIPPKVVRSMGQMFPAHIETGWNFTGLIKFEKYFQRVHYVILTSSPLEDPTVVGWPKKVIFQPTSGGVPDGPGSRSLL
jgi:anaerobic magnesium-protoporphyrin IX monomethyl ester cyclase